MLSALVGAAAAWPLLLLGVVFPRIALFAVSFVPLAKTVPTLWLRLIWVALALIVPIVVGIVVAKRAPQQNLPEPGWKKLLRGFPITVALAAAFLLMLVVAPVLEVAALIKGVEVVHLPAVLHNKLMAPEVMDALANSLGAHGVRLRTAKPPWHMTAPSKILLKIGGAAFASMVTETIEFRRNDKLELAVLPNEAILRGKAGEVARARGAAELAESNLPYEEFQVVYRLLLQLDRAVRGHHPLLSKPSPEEGSRMAIRNKEQGRGRDMIALPSPRTMSKDVVVPPLAQAVPVSPEALSNRQLVSHITESVVLLAKKEIELARTEIKADLKREMGMVKGLGIAGVCALLTSTMLLVTLALGLGNFMAEWLAALLVTAVVLTVGTVAGVVGWGKRVKNPLEATRRTLKEDAQWAKERLA